MSKEDELREILDKTAKEIARTQTNPRTWLAWLTYFLERLEIETVNQNPDKTPFNEMLSALMDVVRNRLKTGGW